MENESFQLPPSTFLDDEFEKAPVNTQLVEHLFKPDWFIDFFSLKNWFCMFYFSAYILQSPQSADHEEETMNLLEPIFGDNERALRYTITSSLALSAKTGPLAMTIPQWTTRLLRLKGMEREATIVASIEFRPTAGYLLKGHDAGIITLESIAGETLKLECSSLHEMSDDIFADYPSMKQSLVTHIGLSDDFVEIKETAHYKNIVLFIQPDNKFSFLDRYASCIKDDRNLFYDTKGADVAALSIILDPDGCSTEMIHYLLERNMLPDARIESKRSAEHGHELVMQNADFLLRFYRGWKY